MPTLKVLILLVTIQRIACDYKACFTTIGKHCLFPFVYDNQTHQFLEQKICSALNETNIQPRCPTELDENLNVLEWGDCLDDCPIVNSGCLEDPTFPVLADGLDSAVNFTTQYPSWIDVITQEFDYVTFTCPDGYVYEGTNNKTHYAICMHQEFIYLFDPSVLCVREYL